MNLIEGLTWQDEEVFVPLRVSLIMYLVRKWVAGEARIVCGLPKLYRRPGRPPTQKRPRQPVVARNCSAH